MRLAQLARKLARRPSEIVEFLASHQIQIEEGSNTRLEDEHVMMVMQQFATGSAITEKIAKEETGADNWGVETVPSSKALIAEENKSSESLPFIPPRKETPEVIKAPKVELSGLKVVGKIDLPEPKKKEPAATTLPKEGKTLIEETKRPQPERSNTSRFKKELEQPWKNPFEEERQRQARETEKRKQAEAQLEKEKRTRNYYNRVKVSAPTKQAKLTQEAQEEMSASELAETPRTWLGRLLKWFRT